MNEQGIDTDHEKRDSLATDILKTTDQEEIRKRQQKAELVVNLGLGFNILLAIVKTTVGILGHSQALLADGINSTSDVVYYIIVKIFVRLAGRPADKEHPYGHHQFESIAALIVGAFVITTGIAIFWDSVNAAYGLITGSTTRESISYLALVVALGTIMIKIVLMQFSVSVGQKTHNPAVVALAHDHRNDIFASIGAAIGITLGMIGFQWVDPLAGALVALIVFKTGIGIVRQSSEDLMDAVPSDVVAGQIKEILAGVAGVESVEEIHAHRFGPYLMLNICIAVDGGISVAEGDAIASLVELRIDQNMELVRKVYVHYHPFKARP